MRRLITRSLIVGMLLCGMQFQVCLSHAQETRTEPRPTPLTRPEMKRLLEEMKQREARIPLPPLSAEEEANTDPRSRGYEGRLRRTYLAASDIRGYLAFAGSPPPRPGAEPRFSIAADPMVSLDYAFKTRLFWIASRANNCQYCLGHQESKLIATGMTDDDVAALDCDWSRFPEGEQTAFALARRLTLEPNRLSDADIDACRKYYTDAQILEMVMSVAGNNSINRWKEGVGVPQSTSGGNFGGGTGDAHSYTTPTSVEFESVVSQVVSGGEARSEGELQPTSFDRQLPSLDEVRRGLEIAKTRSARLPVPDEAEARRMLDATLSSSLGEAPLPAWVRLLAPFPVAGKNTIEAFVTTERDLGLDPVLAARIDYVIAYQDSAWYALGTAQEKLKQLGQTQEEIDGLIAGSTDMPAGQAELLTVARNLAASPVVLTDEEVAAAVEKAGAGDVVKTVHYSAMRASFDRFTEAAALPLD